MKRAPQFTIVLSCTLVSLAIAFPAGLGADERSSRDVGGGVSAGGGGVSVGGGGVGVSAGRAGADVSAGGVTASVDRGGASVSAGDASVSAGRSGASVSAGRSGASVSGGGASVSADRGGARVSADRGAISVDADDDRRPTGTGVRSAQGGRPVGDRSYGSLGEWFEDLRSSWFGDAKDPAEVKMRSSTVHSAETSASGGVQVNRVIQKKAAVATATDGASASANASNVNVTEQQN